MRLANEAGRYRFWSWWTNRLKVTFAHEAGGPLYELRGRGGLLCFRRYEWVEGRYRIAHEKRFRPSPMDWEQFWSVVESLGVWQWRKEYGHPDRTYEPGAWSVRLRKRFRSLTSTCAGRGWPVFAPPHSNASLRQFNEALFVLCGRDRCIHELCPGEDREQPVG